MKRIPIAFHFEQAIAFKRHLAEQKGLHSGEKLSKATLYATLTQLKRFFQWLAWQPGYKSGFQYSDADYFNLSDKDTRIATARREQKAPTLDQVRHVIATMPTNTDIERRNRALIAFALLTGARDRAIASMKLKHVDLAADRITQDAREVNTKFSKTFITVFFPVGDEIRGIVVDWVTFLREDKLWGNDDPLFPATQVGVGPDHQFVASGLQRGHWSSASPIRAIFREAFERAGLQYFNPHSFRKTLVRLGVKLENLIHRVFDPAQVDIEIRDRFGNPVRPREWFLVPLFVVNEVVERIKDGTITKYVYDPTSARLVKAST